MKNKETLRKLLLKKRSAIPAAEVTRLSSKIQEKVMELDEFSSALSVALYHPFRSEVETWGLLKKAVSLGVRVSFPKIVEKSIRYVYHNQKDGFQKSSLGTNEPIHGKEVHPHQLDCIIVPGVGFDLRGHRLGYGWGCFDRFLQDFSGHTIGLAFDLQIQKELPINEDDIPCDIIVSESRIIRRKS